jgi:hypothetical protein
VALRVVAYKNRLRSCFASSEGNSGLHGTSDSRIKIGVGCEHLSSQV